MESSDNEVRSSNELPKNFFQPETFKGTSMSLNFIHNFPKQTAESQCDYHPVKKSVKMIH